MLVDILRFIFFMAIAIPFIYMAFDVTKYIMKNSISLFNRKAKPVLVQYITTIFN